MTYFVSPAGDDAHPGTIEQPWRTIQKAADTLGPGDTVYIREGLYRERVTTHRSGEPGRYITFTSYPGETVTIDGADLPREGRRGWHGLFNVAEQSYIVVSALRVINAERVGIFARDSEHVVIQGNYTADTGSSGILSYRSRRIVIDGNEVVRACAGRGQENISIAQSDQVRVTGNHVREGRKEGIDTKDGSSNVLVQGNYVHHTGRLGIYVDAWDKHTYNVDVIGNIVHDCGGCGFAAASERAGLLENVRFINNIAYRNKSAGIVVAGWNGDYEHPIHNVQIINNTVYGNGWPGHTWGGGIAVESGGARNILIRNNIVADNRGFQLRDDGGGEQVVIDHNLIHGFRGAANEVRGADAIEADPLFADPLHGHFHLREGSPAIDAGLQEAAPGTDIEDTVRPAGEAWDLGAYEYRPPPEPRPGPA